MFHFKNRPQKGRLETSVGSDYASLSDVAAAADDRPRADKWNPDSRLYLPVRQPERIFKARLVTYYRVSKTSAII
jgi:hypothetical protein